MPMQVGPKDIELCELWNTPLQDRNKEVYAEALMRHYLFLAEEASDNDWHPLHIIPFRERNGGSRQPEALAAYLDTVFVRAGYLKGDSEQGYMPTLKFLGLLTLKQAPSNTP